MAKNMSAGKRTPLRRPVNFSYRLMALNHNWQGGLFRKDETVYETGGGRMPPLPKTNWLLVICCAIK